MMSHHKIVMTTFVAWLLMPVGLATANPPWVATGRHAVVATDSAFASDIGLAVLKSGGTAVDAAIAVSFTLAVVRPYSTGLGGGAFTMVRFADGSVIVQDSRESAPGAAREDMYTRNTTDAPSTYPPSRYGMRAVAVPGLLAGRHDLWRGYGSIPFAQLVAPAARLADEGFPIDAHHAEEVSETLAMITKYPLLKRNCAFVYEHHLRDGNGFEPGQTLRQPALAKLLRAVGNSGAEDFYKGKIATDIVQVIQERGGIITMDDLAQYRVKYREPLRGSYRGLEIIAMPPPSSGGIALLQALHILEELNHASMARQDPLSALHYQVEAMKHAFADRARWLGDSDFANVPQTRLLSHEYAREQAAKLRSTATLAFDNYGTERGLNDAGTSHFCIVDKSGTVVVSTETINTSFGSLMAVDDWGLILNNEMDDFAAAGAEPNSYGLIQSSNNRIEPGKRPLSSMTPTIVLKNGNPYLMLGGSGGPRIISSVLNVFLGVVDYEKDLARAMEALRPHHQWSPNRIFFDRDPEDHVADALTGRGHKLSETRARGIIQSVVREGPIWKAASDPRKGGRPAGY